MKPVFFLRMLLVVAVVAGGLPALPSKQAQAAPVPCHEMAATDHPSGSGDAPSSHASCDQCTMGCCLAQIPEGPVFDAVRHGVPVFMMPFIARESFSSAPPTAPPRA